MLSEKILLNCSILPCCRSKPGHWTLESGQSTDMTVNELAREVFTTTLQRHKSCIFLH